MNATQKLSQYVYDLHYDMLDEAVIDYCKILLVDYLAACAAGKKVNHIFMMRLVKFLQKWVGGQTAIRHFPISKFR